MKLRPSVLLSIILAALALSACSATTVTNVWKKESFSDSPLRSIIILAQAGDTLNRSVWENIIAEHFQRSGMNTVPAGSGFSVNPDQVLSYAREKGIDGVLVTRYVDTRTMKRYHPPEADYYYTDRYYYPRRWGYHPISPVPYAYRYPHPGHYPRYKPYFFYEEEIVVTPGYTTYHKVVRVESFLYVSGSREQVWSMTTETIDPRSANHLVTDVSRSVFKSLKKYGLISLSN